MSCTVDSLQINGIYFPLVRTALSLFCVCKLLPISPPKTPIIVFFSCSFFCLCHHFVGISSSVPPLQKCKKLQCSFYVDGATTMPGDRKLKLIIGSAAVLPTYSEHSAASRRATWANTICHVSEGRQGASSPRHQGAHLANLRSQMRSHIGQNGRAEAVNQKSHIQRCAVQTWEMAGSPARHPQEKKRAGLFPAATHQHITPVTSYTPHFIWNAAGPTSGMALPGQHIPPAPVSRACPPLPPPVLSVEIQSLEEHTSSSDNRGGGSGV